LELIVYRSDLLFEPPYTTKCRQPVSLSRELEFRQHLISKFGPSLGGWRRSDESDPMKTGVVYYHQIWDEDGDVLGFAHKKGDVKMTWEVIHCQGRPSAPFTYDIRECPNYREVLELSKFFDYTRGKTIRAVKRFAKNLIGQTSLRNAASGVEKTGDTTGDFNVATKMPGSPDRLEHSGSDAEVDELGEDADMEICM